MDNKTPLLERLNGPDDLRGLTNAELERLATETRERIIEVCSRNGGHLAPSLGTVELTLALLSTFDLSRDKLVWDVGHQSYAYKILTGRNRAFDTLRQKDGLAGFPRMSESPYDFFGVGHSSTSISAALGMATARDLKGLDNHVIAVIGDGALTGGEAFEGLNLAGHLGKRLIVVLNDNEMSISKNVGSVAQYLTQLRRSLEDGGLAEDEINDAMGFYEEIFLDAGAAHEAETAANLGSPEELANKILQDSGIHPQGDSVFQMEAAADPSQARDTDNNVPQNGNSLSKLLVIIITSPIWFSLMCAFAAIALAILCALLSIIIAVFATGFSLTIGGIVTLFTVYPAGIALIGAGLICIGLGGMIVMPVIRCIWRGCVSLFNKFTNFVHRFVSSKAVA